VKRTCDIKICREFATTGYCEKGKDCELRHVFACPEFDEHGKCEKRNCKLVHKKRERRDTFDDILPNFDIDEEDEVDYGESEAESDSESDGEILKIYIDGTEDYE
jgi:hypothetical protein